MVSRKTTTEGTLEYIPTDDIVRNPDNPRLIFRGEELEELANSIQDIGVQVPINVFKSGKQYKLIDGERRWRACRMINLPEIPAIILPKPDKLQNIVFMFNIHRFRKDWDPLPTAMKLQELKEIMEDQKGSPATEADLSSVTGMTRGAIRRCNLIMEIPIRDRRLLLQELEKPEHERVLKTDLFVECQRSVRTIRTYIPKLKHLEQPLRRALINKYKRKVIDNVTHMRKVAKITRAVGSGVRRSLIERELRKLITRPEYTVDEAYACVAWVYDVRSIKTQATSLGSLIKSMPSKQSALDSETRRVLRDLAARIRRFLGSKGR